MAKFTNLTLHRNFTTVSNAFLQDKNLDIASRGLLMTILSLPEYQRNGEPWNFSTIGLASILPDGKAKVATALKKLEECGYLWRRRIYVAGKVADWEYIFNDEVMTEALEAYRLKLEKAAAKSSKREKQPKDIKRKKSLEMLENIELDLEPENRVLVDNPPKKLEPENLELENLDLENRVLELIKEHKDKIHKYKYKEEVSANLKESKEEQTSPRTPSSKLQLIHVVCKIFNNIPSRLNGIEMGLIDNWERMGVTPDLVQLAAEDCLYIPGFTIKHLNKTIEEWMRADVTDVESAKAYIEERHQENLKKKRSRYRNSRNDNLWKSGKDVGIAWQERDVKQIDNEDTAGEVDPMIDEAIFELFG